MTAAARSEYQMDDTDRALIRALDGNVRRPTLELANTVGISSPTAKRRIARLRELGLLHLGPVLDLHAAGYEFLLTIGIHVEGRPPLQVAKEIATLESTLTVNVVTGDSDVEVVAALKSREEVSELLSTSLSNIEGVAQIEPALALEVWKFQRGRRKQNTDHAPKKRLRLDDLDLEIVHCLSDDVRQSNRAIASRLNISESAVRSRIRQMQKNKQLSLTTPYPIPPSPVNDAFVGIRVHGGKTKEVCQSLVSIDEISLVYSALGRHDIVCCIHVTQLQELERVLREKIVGINGVRSITSAHCITQLKHQSLLGLVV